MRKKTQSRVLFAYVAPVVAVGSSTNVYQRHGQYRQQQTLHTYFHFVVVYTGETLMMAMTRSVLGD
jgi:hypothetical protein